MKQDLCQRRTDGERVVVGDYFGAEDRYYNYLTEMAVTNVHIGKQYITSNPKEMMVALVGSSVAVCLFDHVKGISGMAHILIPCNSQGIIDHLKFGAPAIDSLISAMRLHGCNRSDLSAKLFGGGSVLLQHPELEHNNIRFILNYLRGRNIAVEAKDLGGHRPRCVHFHTNTGKILRRNLRRKEDYNNLRNEEEAYLQKLNNRFNNYSDVINIFGSSEEKRQGMAW